MSWSENRTGSKPKANIAEVEEKVRNINAVFEKLSKDEDFQDDLKLPIVEKALKHWTNQHRLSPEEAMQFQEHRRVIYVLQRFQMVQAVCRDALIPIPLELVSQGKTKIHKGIVSQIYKAHGYVLEEPAKTDRKPQDTSAPANNTTELTQQSKAATATASMEKTAEVSSAHNPTGVSQVAEGNKDNLLVHLSLLATLAAVFLAILFYFVQQSSNFT
ncbi:hypothetical protein EON65_23460 [archaeon]|nr:MAG: hypothetical protein EON65_23460 [archaeon]